MVRLHSGQRQAARHRPLQHRQPGKSTATQYKRESLFGSGLKPLSRSLVFEKGWRRGCHGVEYFGSEVVMEGRRGKHYRVLSFKYDFIFEEDCVRFCYCLPYSYSQLGGFLAGLSSQKVPAKV